MKVAFLSDGRDWAYRIAEGLSQTKNKKWELSEIVTTPELLFPRHPIDKLGIPTKIIDPKELPNLYSQGFFDKFDIFLFYGWSWIVPEEIVNNKVCICSHPSPLPKYRGGSPIQNQIINGETKSMISLFQMAKGLDDGPIYTQKPISLEGHLKDVIEQIGEVGLQATIEMLDGLAEGRLKPVQQNESEATVYKRRKKSESELTGKQLTEMTSIELFNFIRALEDPYPNAYVNLADGKLVFKVVELSKDAKGNKIKLEELKSLKKAEIQELLKAKFLLQCKDGNCIEVLQSNVD